MDLLLLFVILLILSGLATLVGISLVTAFGLLIYVAFKALTVPAPPASVHP